MSDKTPYSQATYTKDLVEVVRAREKLRQDPAFRVLEPLGNRNIYIAKRQLRRRFSAPPWAPGTLPHDKDFLYQPTVWIVSPGHSGSSLLHEKLGQACMAAQLSASGSKYPVLKSHSHCFKWKGKNCLMTSEEGGFMWEIEEDDKVIYLYSHPLNILLSFVQKMKAGPAQWLTGNNHYLELLCDTSEDFLENYLYKDILGLERHLDCWWKQRGIDTLCIKYEKLFQHADDIRNFIKGRGEGEINFELPPWRKRKTDWTKDTNKEQLLETYASVIKKYEQKPDCELFLRTKNVV
jgi:hypothetical protein